MAVTNSHPSPRLSILKYPLNLHKLEDGNQLKFIITAARACNHIAGHAVTYIHVAEPQQDINTVGSLGRPTYLGKPSEAGFSVRGECWVLCKTCPHLHTHTQSIQDETTFVELGRLCAVTQMLHTKYHTAKRFRGTKLLQISWFFTKFGGAASFGVNSEKSAKVFPAKIFFLLIRESCLPRKFPAIW